ncbi:MAG: transglycosylase SLT domain-containing protein [Thermoanaerobaculia bacterium]
MLGFITFALAVTVADPRPDLVELQLSGQHRQALARVEEEIARRPEPSRRLGLSYLQGHLLDLLGRAQEAAEAFAKAMAETPVLEPYGRYRMALDMDETGHPEVAAGLIAKVVAGDPASPLFAPAVSLLGHTLREGGDCQVLSRLRVDRMPAPQRRQVQLALAECTLGRGHRELARGFLFNLIEESREDETAGRAADRLATLASDGERGRLPLLLGLTFERHGEIDRALQQLQRSLGKGDGLSPRDAREARFRMGRSLLELRRYAEAAQAFERLAAQSKTPGERARALFHAARAQELRGNWPAAAAGFRQAYAADPKNGDWAAPSLLSALRLEWRRGSEASALELYGKLTARPEWKTLSARAALFLVASDLSRGRRDRAKAWLDQAATDGRDERLEALYWSGRLADLQGESARAVFRYLELLRADPYHPLSHAAQVRLRSGTLAAVAGAEAQRLASSRRPQDLYAAWLLLGGGSTPAGQAMQRRLEKALLADKSTAPFLRIAQVPVRKWPLWDFRLDRPEEMLLGLGVWPEGSPAIADSFPISDPSLGFTGGVLLARAGDVAAGLAVAEQIRGRTPGRVPLELQPREFRRLLFPLPYEQVILDQARVRGVGPALLSAVVREESRFDPEAFSAGSGRGLTQLNLPAARRLGAQLNMARLSPDDLYRSEVAIALGAAQLGALLKTFAGGTVQAVAAYDAGEPQALLWRNFCFTQDPDEFYSKVSTPSTRDYVRRVLAAREQYDELY